MFKKIFNKKEKPIRVYNVFEIGEKAIYSKYFTYVPTQVEYYDDKIVFSLNVFETPNGEENAELQKITAVAKMTEERLVPVEICGRDLFWDTVDMAFRRKVMPEGEAVEIAPTVHMYPNEVLTIKRDFAEKYLSPEALSYALLKDDERYIWYYPDGSCAPAIMEIPKVFDPFKAAQMHPLTSEPVEVSNFAAIYAGEYLEKKGITMSNFPQVYVKNYKRELIFD